MRFIIIMALLMAMPVQAWTRDGGSFGLGESFGAQSAYGGEEQDPLPQHYSSYYEERYVETDYHYICDDGEWERVSEGHYEGFLEPSGSIELRETYNSAGGSYRGTPIYSKALNDGYGSYFEAYGRLGNEYGENGEFGRGFGSRKRFLLEYVVGTRRNNPQESTNEAFFQESGRGFHGRVWG